MDQIWSDRSLLKILPNVGDHECKIKTRELTFMGVKNQPDYAEVFITMYPKDNVIELRALKKYFQQFREKIISYERLISVVYDDLMLAYQPARIRIVMVFNARGGISSRLTIDSDWKIRGGKEEYCDWVGQSEEW